MIRLGCGGRLKEKDICARVGQVVIQMKACLNKPYFGTTLIIGQTSRSSNLLFDCLQKAQLE
jgi:hypothetical protein